MSENKNLNISLVPQSVDKTLENILEQPSKSIGCTFSDIWYLIFGGHFNFLCEKKKIKYAAELEKYKNEIKEKFTSIPQERKGEVDLQMIGQTLNASKYCIDKVELRNMFVNLLASAVDINKNDKIHPSYAEVIKEMSRDEALLLVYLSENLEKESNRFPLLDIRHIVSRNIKYCVTGTNIVKIVNSKQNKIQTLYTNTDVNDFGLGNIYINNQTDIGKKAKCNYPEKISQYLLNLERLRLIDIKDRKIVDIESYNKIINSKFIENILLHYKDDIFIEETVFCFIRKYFCITEYGLNFIECCIR